MNNMKHLQIAITLLLILISTQLLATAEVSDVDAEESAKVISNDSKLEQITEDNMITMIHIFPGEFKFGSGKIKLKSETNEDEDDEEEDDDEDEDEVELDETPPFIATITYSYWISKTEITQLQYQHIMNENPSFFRGDNRPVDQVSWNHAALFCNLLSEKCGYEKCYDEVNWKCDYLKNGFRLPTEAEWIYACNTGLSTDYYFEGSPEELMKDYAVFDSGNGKLKEPSVVGTRKPNRWGLYDMYGNVFEWCNDYYSDSLDPENKIDPRGVEISQSELQSSGTSLFRVIKGGGWGSFYYDCRTQNRGSADPLGGYDDVGFRIVRTFYKNGKGLK